jgi:hypothetical protein
MAQDIPAGFEMKLSHAAALVLVGWYLMIPPIALDTSAQGRTDRFSRTGDRGWIADTSAPLTDWTIKRKYIRIEDCQEDRPYQPNAICVQSDDLRLRLK